jgi:ComF family protein
MPSDSFRTSPVCSACWTGIKPYGGPSCRVCSRPLVSGLASSCGECIAETPHFKAAVCFGLYEGAVREAIHILKFSGVRRLSSPLAGLLLDKGLPPADFIVPVPLSAKGLRKRGFNQSALIGKHISKYKGIPLLTGALVKTKETLPQVGLLKKERKANVRGAFAARGNLKGKKIILLDDVMTTGATVNECSKMLMKAGAEDVLVLTVARAGSL